jgi:predicted dehydrogenase
MTSLPSAPASNPFLRPCLALPALYFTYATSLHVRHFTSRRRLPTATVTASSNPSPIRLGLVGVGGHGQTHQDAIARTEAACLDVVFDVDPDAVAAAARRFDCSVASSYDDLLARPDLDAVVLATPNSLHREQAEQAFAAGCDVLVEKPIATTVSDGRAVVDAADRAGRVLLVGHNMRLGRPARQTRQLLDDGDLGTPVSMEIHFSSPGTRALQADSWRLEPGQRDALPILQLGIHGIDLVHAFFGPIREVVARSRSVQAPDGVADAFVVLFRTESGIQGTLISNYCTQVTFTYRVTGTDATIESRAHRLSYRRTDDVTVHDEGPETTYDFSDDPTESYVRQMEAFVEAVRTRTIPENDGLTALQAMAVTEAIAASAQQGKPVSVRSVLPDPPRA